jgi:hypothetical protein
MTATNIIWVLNKSGVAIYWVVTGIKSKHCRCASDATGKTPLLHGRKYSLISLCFVS